MFGSFRRLLKSACSIWFDALPIPLNTGQDCRHIVRWAPSVLQDVQAQFTGSVYVRMKHLTDELDRRWFVWILFLKVHNQSKGAIFKRCVGGSNDHSIPGGASAWHKAKTRASYQVMTLSATGEADTPAGGSVCMRWGICQFRGTIACFPPFSHKP